MRTADGYSKTGLGGNGLFTLLGFMGMYMVLANALPVPGAARNRARTRRHWSGERSLRLRLEEVR